MATPRLKSDELALGYICTKCRSWTQGLRAEPLLLPMPLRGRSNSKLLTMWPSSKGTLRAKVTVLELGRRERAGYPFGRRGPMPSYAEQVRRELLCTACERWKRVF